MTIRFSLSCQPKPGDYDCWKHCVEKHSGGLSEPQGKACGDGWVFASQVSVGWQQISQTFGHLWPAYWKFYFSLRGHRIISAPLNSPTDVLYSGVEIQKRIRCGFCLLKRNVYTALQKCKSAKCSECNRECDMRDQRREWIIYSNREAGAEMDQVSFLR